MTSLFQRAARALAGTACAALLFTSPAFADDAAKDSVAARLGGAEGIAAFINGLVVPALVASELRPFFTGDVVPLQESTSQTVTCLARLLDHDLGGSSPKNGSIAVDPAASPAKHECRSSMSNVHRGMKINDAQFALFINIVATQALAAGVAPADVAEVGKVLSRYRGSVTDK